MSTTLASTFAAFPARAKGGRREFVSLVGAKVRVIGELHLYGNSYDPRGHLYQALTCEVAGRLYPCVRRGENYAIGQVYEFKSISALAS